MNKQATLDAVYGVLVKLRAAHPHGLRAIGDANAHAVLTRHGIRGDVAELCSIWIETLAEHGGMQNPLELIEFLADDLADDGSLIEPMGCTDNGIAPGERDERGLATHPEPMFTAVNWNGKRYGVQADARPKGLAYYEAWLDADRLASAGLLLRVWDAQDACFLEPSELLVLTAANN